jgi:hypothetical protein
MSAERRGGSGMQVFDLSPRSGHAFMDEERGFLLMRRMSAEFLLSEQGREFDTYPGRGATFGSDSADTFVNENKKACVAQR